MTSGDQDDVPSEEKNEEIADATEFFFGPLDPVDWAHELNRRLFEATKKLASARTNYNDKTRDSTDQIEADAKTKLRLATTEYLSEIFVMLHALELFWKQPPILEAFKFIITEIASLEKGTASRWLIANPSKQHFKSTTKEAEWVPIIASLELALLKSSIHSVDAATRYIALRTGRKIGTIKDWHKKLNNGGSSGPPLDPTKKVAADSIRTIVYEMRALLHVEQEPEARDRRLTNRINDLLGL